MPNETIAAVVQLCARQDVDENLDRCEALVETAADRGARIVVLPENFPYIGTLKEKLKHAEELDTSPSSPVLHRMSELARRLEIHLVAGGVPVVGSGPDKFYNTSVLFDATGAIAGSYRKIHLFDIAIPDGPNFVESAYVAAGDRAVTLDCQVGETALKIGMSVCYDLRFPELYRGLTQQGAEVITVAAAFTLHTGKDHWLPLLRARAIENQVFVLAAGQWGKHNAQRCSFGKSCIVDPWGAVLALCPDDDAVAVAALDLGYQANVRRSLPCLEHIARRDWSGERR